MASADPSRRGEKVVGYPPLSDLGDLQSREFHEPGLEAASFEDLPGKWQSAILVADQNRPELRVIGGLRASPSRLGHSKRKPLQVATFEVM